MTNPAASANLRFGGVLNPLANQQPRPKGTGYVVLIRYLYSGFNTFINAINGGVLNPSTRINMRGKAVCITNHNQYSVYQY